MKHDQMIGTEIWIDTSGGVGGGGGGGGYDKLYGYVLL